MLKKDIEIIRYIEKALCLTLHITAPDKFSFLDNCYSLDKQGQVIAISIHNISIDDRRKVTLLLEKLISLRILFLTKNDISDISFLKKFKQLYWLYLNENKIVNISPLKELVFLNSLSLSNNCIVDISFLKELNQLHALDLSGNRINDISSISYLKQLRYVNLANNQINDINVFSEFKNLRNLNLQENKISKLPAYITDLSPEIVLSKSWNDDIINVGGNPLTSPPPEIIQQGREAIRAYFRSFEKDEAVTLHEAKVLLVGDGKAGKTSLLKQLQGLPFDDNESQTHGINVVSLHGGKLPGFVQPDADCRLHFWDFGGQEIMHASHRFFMSSRSLYILVLDSRDDTGRCHWRWLRHIEKYGGQSPLIVAMNKMDANPSYNIEQKSINSRFAAIENRFFQISCKNKDGLPELVRSMAASVPKTPLYGLVISKAWLTIRKRLEETTEAQNYISQEQFLAICKEHGVDDEESRMTMLNLFHDLGTLLFFEKLKLVDIYVLDPHWVTVGVYKIINSAKTKDGLLREEDLEYILNQEPIRCDEYDPAKKAFAYTVREQEYLVRIMEEFELCYRYDKHLHILPGQLPKEPEQEPELRDGNLLRFIMEYDFLPSSLFPRLMVRLKEDIPNRRQQWRYGMFLENSQFGVQAIVKMEEQSGRITISIQGGPHSKREYLSVIRHNISGIAKEFAKLKLKELVPLPKHQHDDLEYFVEYQELLGYERAGRNEYFHGKSCRAFSVSELLDSVVSKYERIKEGNNIMIHLENIGNPQVTQTNSQQQSQHQQQSANLFKEAQGLFRNLKEDIIAEADIELDDAKEKKRVENELAKTEKALAEAESAAAAGKEPDAAAKSRLEEFFNSLADKSSRLGRLLESVDQGTEKVRNLARILSNYLPSVLLILANTGY